MTLRGIWNTFSAKSSTPDPTRTQLTPNFRWVGRCGNLSAGGLQLFDPLVYVFDSRRGTCPEPAAIDVALDASGASPPPSARELSYWPSYQELLPHQRRRYLQWLASDRSSVPQELGYAFLFFYNLERRAFVDQADIGLIWNEVIRLQNLYSASPGQHSGSWDGYSNQFLCTLALLHKEAIAVDEIRNLARSTVRWTDERLAIMLACLAIRGCRLTASLAFHVAGFVPQSLRSIVHRRVPQEFEALFKKRFREQFPDGIELKISKAKRTFTYRPASRALQPMEMSIPNVFGLQSQFKPLSKIWNSSTDDLKKLGTLSKAGAEVDAIKRWEALPDPLRAGTDHPLTDEFCKVVDSHAGEDSQIVIPVEEITAILDPEGSVKLSIGRSRRLCQTAEQIGYFLEPDARLTGRAYRQDERVIAFLKMSTAPIDRSRYVPAACMLQFGFLVANSDGQAGQNEIDVISRHIEGAFDLQEDEVRRMERLRFLLQKTGPDRSLLRRLVRDLGKLQRQAIAKLLFALVLTDGIVTDAENKSLRAACLLLGVEFAQFETMLSSSEKPDEPVVVVSAKAGRTGEKLPLPPQKSLGLNRTTIDAILAETREVAEILAKAMAIPDEEDDDHDVESLSAVEQSVTVVEGPLETSASVSVVVSNAPPAKYRSLYETLSAQDRLPLREAEALARKEGMMLAGVVDALNEWSLDAYGGQLFYEEGEFLVIERSLLN